MNGLDFAGWRPGAGWIASSGFGFVVRYLKWLPNPYAISLDEFNAYRAAGLHVVLNWEQTAMDQLGGASAGAIHAEEAMRQADLLGAWPCPIYFSADWDVNPAEQTACNAYLAAAGSVIGRENVGGYGGYWYIKRALEAGVITWAWQTLAWSGGLWHPDAHIRQVGVGNNYDNDLAMADNFGQVGAQAAPPEEEEDLYSMGFYASKGCAAGANVKFGGIYCGMFAGPSKYPRIWYVDINCDTGDGNATCDWEAYLNSGDQVGAVASWKGTATPDRASNTIVIDKPEGKEMYLVVYNRGPQEIEVTVHTDY